jgi:plasmid replication initiation protein
MLLPQSESQAHQLAFRLDSPLRGNVKNDRTVMVFNFFALCKERIVELPIYEDGQVRIEVTGNKHGVATIWDKEILIYIASLLQEKLNQSEPISRRVTFTAHDFLRVCCTSIGGSAYERIEEALLRLQGTQIKTNIETGGAGEDSAFSWVTDYKIEYIRNHSGDKRLKSITVEICEWLFRAIVKDQRMLTYDLGYFKLGPLERRLYEIARAHCGRQSGFRMNLEKLRKRVGSDTTLKAFKKHLADIMRQGTSMPTYGIMLIDPQYTGRIGVVPTRVPLKRLQVYFFQTGGLSQEPPTAAPLLEEEDCATPMGRSWSGRACPLSAPRGRPGKLPNASSLL